MDMYVVFDDYSTRFSSKTDLFIASENGGNE